MAQTNMYQSKTEMKMDNGGEEQDHLRKMFIGGLAAVTTEDSLRAFYSQWGDVVDSVVMRDPATRRSRGFGFVTFSDSSMVDKAQSSRPHIIDGKSVDSKRALPRPELGKSEQSNSVKKIFVGGLKENHDEQSLSEHFSQFGNVVSVKIPTDKNTSRKRGFAFIEFDDYDSVDKAVLHKNHTIKYVLVDVKKSVYKQELAKKQQLQQSGMMTTPGGVAPPGQHAGGYQQNNVYNAQAAYAYPPQMQPPPAGAYNGWGGYAQAAAPGYQQAPGGAPVAGYGAYGAPQQNGAGAAAWNTANPYAAQQSWAQNGYGGPAAPASVPAAAAAPATSANHGWNGSNGGQNFGDYQQTYNGGPQKASSLQGNRMNPYTISSTPNYGATTGYVNNYAVANKVAKPIESGASSRNGPTTSAQSARHVY